MATPLPAWLQCLRGHAIGLLFPNRCLSCGTDLYDSPIPEKPGLLESDFCQRCLEGVENPVGEPQTGRNCLVCAATIPDYLGVECPHCGRKKMKFDRAIALGPYQGQLRKLVLRMKQDRSETIARALGKRLCYRLEKEQSKAFQSIDFGDQGVETDPFSDLSQIDFIVPIPMNPWRQVARGTNGPAILARKLSQHFAIPVHFGLLGNCRNSIPQKGLSRKSRFQNIRGGMSLRAGYPIESTKVLLVDDILTTGATCSEAARILKLAGVEQVSVVVVARTAG